MGSRTIDTPNVFETIGADQMFHAKRKMAEAAGCLRLHDSAMWVYVAAWEEGRLGKAFDELLFLGERHASSREFWIKLSDAARLLGKTSEADRILRDHGGIRHW